MILVDRKAVLAVVALSSAVAALAAGENSFTRTESLRLRSVTSNRQTVPVYEPLELTLELSATFDNPFAPEDIDVHAVFTSPRGRAITVNAFWYQLFKRRLEGESEKIEPAGEPLWKLRFTPDCTGKWEYQVHAKDRSGSTGLPKASFVATESPARGFIRRSASNPRVFAWDNEQAFFGIGENVCWGGKRGSFDYDDWLPALGKAGGNFIRIWMCSWNCALEWAEHSRGELRSGDYHNVGLYSLDNAWKLDTILEIAQRNGISVMLCLGTYGEFNEGGYFNEGQWKANPYNVANGGPCSKPEEFWTNATARKLYQRRLRYLAARYGHRTNLHSWEFWNEAKAPAPWVAEMARFLKGSGEFQGRPADPYGHLVTTTYGEAAVWEIPEIDYTQTHSYGTGNYADHAPVLYKEARNHDRFGKPHWSAEFGIDWRSPDNKYDPDGIGLNLHNALWASALSGDAGGALIWWWDSYVHPKRLYPHFGALQRFTDTVPWTDPGWKPLKAEATASGHALNDSAGNTITPRIVGIVNGRKAFAWVQNPESNWKNQYEKKAVSPLGQIELTLGDLPSGKYGVKWWDTWKGKSIGGEDHECAEGGLRLTLKALDRDLALQVVGK
jgi:hypothetical protein